MSSCAPSTSVSEEAAERAAIDETSVAFCAKLVA
eukprot:CAMPEP_0177378876 /NCGR_PEP_ID=MMETSP0368-20130122/46602_1 /TAXON_ID=447022 ORGANISM="Scrippsiella hangoei-like, Strain SHHI-4" /NCGR_SAMPLE_ID=MMETSP0368 /ASSEMBLY_ACC=CAM_ASM_000363 /LENGTH=33 /DNA_ID= /DNA_START= /DNA_END= /DNA_ORIENTATION=